jgi:predicted nucleic acid-binding protein
MRRNVLLDTGPLVAFLNRRDRYHRWALTQWGEIQPPFLTCESVLSEACFLLRGDPRQALKALELVSRGVIAVPYRVEEEASLLGTLMSKYSDIPMSLADACLVRLLEKTAGSWVLTLDRDFTRYRKHGRQAIDTILPGRPA